MSSRHHFWSLQDELEREYEHAPANDRPPWPPSALTFAVSETAHPVPPSPGGSGEARTIAPHPDAALIGFGASGWGTARTKDKD